MTVMRNAFYAEAEALLSDDPRTALVLADISAAAFEPRSRGVLPPTSQSSASP
jgi:hypothetical protein